MHHLEIQNSHLSVLRQHDHMDITPVFHNSFNVWICRICHRYESEGQFLSFLSLPPSIYRFHAFSAELRENPVIIITDNYQRQTPCKQGEQQQQPPRTTRAANGRSVRGYSHRRTVRCEHGRALRSILTKSRHQQRGFGILCDHIINSHTNNHTNHDPWCTHMYLHTLANVSY